MMPARRALAVLGLAAAAAMPALGQVKGLPIVPGYAQRIGPKPKRPDAARISAAQAKRERKNAKRLRDWCRSEVHRHPALRSSPRWWVYADSWWEPGNGR